MTIVNPQLTPGSASAPQTCRHHRRSAAAASAESLADDVPRIHELVKAVASLERIIDALRRDIQSGDRTIQLLSDAQEASTGYESSVLRS